MIQRERAVPAFQGPSPSTKLQSNSMSHVIEINQSKQTGIPSTLVRVNAPGRPDAEVVTLLLR